MAYLVLLIIGRCLIGGNYIKKGEKPNEAGLREKKLNSIKSDNFPWMLEVTKSAPKQAIKDLGQAFSRFFKKLTRLS